MLVGIVAVGTDWVGTGEVDVVHRCPTGKVSHSRGMAEAQLRSIHRMNPDYNGHVYPCVQCQGWHVGRAKKFAHKNKYAGVT